MKNTYNVTLHLPSGIQKGTLTLNDQNEKLNGSIHALGYVSYFRDGKINGNSFEFSGSFSAGLFNLQYKATGTIEDENIRLVADTNFGTYQIAGTRKA